MMHTPRPGESQAISRRPRLTLSTLLLVGSLLGATAASAASFYSLTDLGTLGGDWSIAYAINASGQVTGWAETPSGEGHAFLYDRTTMRDLGTLGAYPSLGAAINASGQVAGFSYPPGSWYAHAFLYDGTTMRDLGSLGGGWSGGYAINASGQVVGDSYTPSVCCHPFLYDGTATRDLNDLLDTSGAGWTLWQAVDINDAGQIAANASHPNGDTHAVLLTPWRSVPIDITPGDFPNSINPRSKGKITVAILSSPTFDAPAQVDQGSLRFGRMGDEPSLASCTSGPADVNGDGWPDLVCHFHTPTAAFQAGDTEGVLKGKTVAAVPLPFYGFDSVRIVPK